VENQRRRSAGGGAGHIAEHVKEAARAAGVVNLKHFHAGGKPQGNEQRRIERDESSVAPGRRQECGHAQWKVEHQVDGGVAQHPSVDSLRPRVQQHPQRVCAGAVEIEVPGVEGAVDDQRDRQQQQTVH